MEMKGVGRPQTRMSERMSLSQFMEADSPVVRAPDVSRAMKRRSINVNLRKSLQILDEAVGSPRSALLSGRTPASMKRSAYTPMKLPSDETMDVSAMFGPHSTSIPGPSFLATPKHGNRTEMEDDITTTNVALLLEEDPGIAVCSGLFSEFSDAMKNNPALHQVFQLVGDYETMCKENATQLRNLVKKAVPGQEKFTRTVDMMHQLNQEGDTWSLLSSLYRDRMDLDVQSDPDHEPMMLDTTVKYQSEQELVGSYFEKDNSVRQAQLVVDWLEKIARDQWEIYHRVEFFSDDMGAWENTLHALRQRKNGHTTGTERPIVTQLDPDAPIRQGKPLADLDLEDEARLVQHLFAFVRAGQLEEAQKLCVKVGQAWRAAALEGWRLYHDPNFNQLGPEGRVERVSGNPNRDMWKAMCWTMTEQEKFSQYERALYAVFCGNLRQILPVLTSWMDYMWAYFRVLVDQLVEQEVRLSGAVKQQIPLPASYWDKRLSVEKIFNDIQACPKQDICEESRSHFHIIQKYIILSDTDHLIEEMYEWSKDELRPPSEHLLRFMAHLVLFLRSIGVSSKEELCVSILEAYVRHLIEGNQSHLVAMYVATLPHEIQVEWYAKFLEGVTDTEERKQCLTLAEEADLDIPNITKLVVENIRSRDSNDFNGDADLPSDASTSKEDQQKIEAIEWLVFDPSQRAEALRQANAVMRAFLATRKMLAAREVFAKIPPGSMELIMQTWLKQTGSTDLRPEDDNAIKEYLCHQAYLDGHDSFNDWMDHYHNAKPSKPNIPTGANFTERVAYEHKEKQYEMDLGRWKHNLMIQTKVTCDKLYNVLLFIDGGWMVDKRLDGPRDDHRTHQMRLLRQLCLPILCFLLHTVLHNTDQYKQCLQLADLIGSEQYHLYKTFRKDELQQLLHKLRESSVALLDTGMDSLGYPLTQ